MNRNQAKPVDRLSFDVLGEIFSHYAKEESIFHPLETLLLVSQSWSQAALGHRSLWGRLRICLGHDPCCKIWMTRLPLRLRRSGSSIPLEIEFWSSFSPRDKKQPPSNISTYERKACSKKVRTGKSSVDRDMCQCQLTGQKTFLPMLKMLVGTEGENCRRWARAEIDFYEFTSQDQDSVNHILSHPAPLLTHLALTEVWRYSKDRHQQSPGFPTSTPNLQHLHFHRYSMSRLPDLHNIRELTLDLGLVRTFLPIENYSALTYATRLEVLNLGWIDTPIVLPKELPYLWSLSLNTMKPPANFRTFKAPRLRRLCIQTARMEIFEAIIQGVNLPLQQIEEFVVGTRPMFHYVYGELLELMPQIMQRLGGLKRIGGDKRALAVMLKMFWEVNMALGQSSWGESFVGREITFGIALEKPSIVVDDISIVFKEFGNRQNLSDCATSLGLVPLHLPRVETWKLIG